MYELCRIHTEIRSVTTGKSHYQVIVLRSSSLLPVAVYSIKRSMFKSLQVQNILLQRLLTIEAESIATSHMK